MMEKESKVESRFKFLEHTTDAEIESCGKNLSEAFENAGLATEETMVSLSSIKKSTKRDVQLEAGDIESLLYSWLEKIISFQDTEGMLFSRFVCKISGRKKFKLKAICFGEKFDPKRHEQKTAIKAPTYHDMKIERGKKRVTMRFLLDL